MQIQIYSCSRCVGKNVEFIKYGKTKEGKQRYQCTNCKKTSILNFKYKAYCSSINSSIVKFIKEGLGIRSIARLLQISPTTLLKRIIFISSKIEFPKLNSYEDYEIDELCTFIKKKTNRFWLVYALNRKSKEVVCFNIGKRNNITLSKVINKVLNSKPCNIFTDSLRNYSFLIPKENHKTVRYGTNNIERKNLCLRTHLKRLNRRTICFSRSQNVFNAIMKIYFWL